MCNDVSEKRWTCIFVHQSSSSGEGDGEASIKVE